MFLQWKGWKMLEQVQPGGGKWLEGSQECGRGREGFRRDKGIGKEGIQNSEGIEEEGKKEFCYNPRQISFHNSQHLKKNHFLIISPIFKIFF